MGLIQWMIFLYQNVYNSNNNCNNTKKVQQNKGEKSEIEKN